MNNKEIELQINNKLNDDTSSIQTNTTQQTVEKQKQPQKISHTKATINMTKGYIGSGVLALPYSFDEAGYILSSVVFIIIAFTIHYATLLILKVSDKVSKPGDGYMQIGEKMLGRKQLLVLKCFFVLGSIGACTSYVIFFIQFFERATGDTEGNNDFLYLLAALCIILPLSLFNDMALLVKYVFVANILMVSTLSTILIYSIYLICDEIEQDDGRLAKNASDVATFSHIPMMIGVSMYSFGAIQIVFGVKNTLENPETFIKKVLNIVNVAVSAGYIVFSITCVLAYGHTMNPIILFSLPDNLFCKLMEIGYAISLVITYPLILLPGLQVLENKNNFIGKFIKHGQKFYIIKRFAFRSLVTLFILLGAFLIPNFHILLNIIGSVGGAALQYFFPIWAYEKIFANQMKKKEKIFNKFIMGIGLLGGTIALVFSIIELINPQKGD